MSLLEDVQRAVAEAGNVSPEELLDYLATDENENPLSLGDEELPKIVDDVWMEDKRWCEVRMAVINRGDENVAYVYNEPATEMQDWSDWSASDTEVYEVETKQVTKTVYTRLDPQV